MKLVIRVVTIAIMADSNDDGDDDGDSVMLMMMLTLMICTFCFQPPHVSTQDLILQLFHCKGGVQIQRATERTLLHKEGLLSLSWHVSDGSSDEGSDTSSSEDLL